MKAPACCRNQSCSYWQSRGCPRLDADQDELLSLPEFNAGARNREVKASDLFQSIDSDGNGYLDAKGHWERL